MSNLDKLLNDDISDILGSAPVRPVAYAPAAHVEQDASDAPATFQEKCGKCNGRGRFISWSGRTLGNCFACQGQGFKTFRTSTVDRAKSRANVADRKARKEAATLDAFAKANPAVWAWIESSAATFEFAAAMREAVVKFGDLTEKQMAACVKCVAARAAKAAERVAAVASAPAVETDNLMSAFDAAKATGLKRPKMRFEAFEASLAPANGKNAGAVYLKAGETYLGKIAGGKLHTTRDCDDATRAAIVATMADPLAAAVAFGKRTGRCCCCGRELTDPVSVANGIGPICEESFGF